MKKYHKVGKKQGKPAYRTPSRIRVRVRKTLKQFTPLKGLGKINF